MSGDPALRLTAASATDIGRIRSSNQDCAYVGEGLVAVADGMGGHAGGDVAAQMAVQVLAEHFAGEHSVSALVKAAKDANRAILERSESEPTLRGMGTTLSAAALVSERGEVHVAVVHVGDSRVYVKDGTGLNQLTADHSLVEEMVRHGELTEDEASIHPQRHILTRALGIDPGVEVDSWSLALTAGTRLVLCSDGLTNECSDREIATILEANPDPSGACRALVASALSHGGSDNVTVVVADLVEDAPQPLAADDGLAVAPAIAASLPPQTARRAARHGDRTSAPPAAPQAPWARQAGTPASHHRRRVERIVTPWSVLYVLLFVGTLGGIAGFTVWYVDATYFVGLHDGRVAIFQGRPGGFLWFKPKLVEVTGTPPSKVFPPYRTLLRSGMIETSYSDAQRVAKNLTNVNSFLALPGSNTSAAAAGTSGTSGLSGTSGTATTTSGAPASQPSTTTATSARTTTPSHSTPTVRAGG